MSERFCLEGNEIKDNGFFLSGKVQYTEVMNRLNNNVNQLKQQLEEKDNLIEFGREEIRKRNKRIDDIVERDKKLFNDKNKELEKLKQQLAEAEEYIENDEVTKREYYQKTDEIIAEKDKEIERLKVFEKIYYQNQLQASQETINKLFQSAYQSPVAVGLNQIAIQELEKVKDCCESYALELNKREDNKTNNEIIKYLYAITEIIDNQIKELKGE